VCVCEQESMPLSVSQAWPRTLGLLLHSSPRANQGIYVCVCVFHFVGVYLSLVRPCVCVCVCIQAAHYNSLYRHTALLQSVSRCFLSQQQDDLFETVKGLIDAFSIKSNL